MAAAQAPLAVLPAGDAERSAAIDEGLRAALAAQSRFTAQSPDRTVAYVTSAAELGLSCAPEDDTCLGKLAVLSEVRALLVPTVVGDALRVRFVEVGDTPGVRDVTRPLAGDPRTAAEQAGVLLLAPERARGRLRLDVTPPGAVVALDGSDLGAAPLAEPVPTDPGPHLVRARHGGFESAEVEVNVPFAGEATATLALEPVAGQAPAAEPAAATPPDAFNPLATTGLVVAGAGGGLVVIGLASALTFESLAQVTFNDLSMNGVGDKETVEGMVAGAQVSWVGTMVAGALALVGASLWAAGTLAES